MSTAMVSLGIATGFERSYGVLKRLGATPLGRPRLLAAKTAAVVLIEIVQLDRAGARLPTRWAGRPAGGWALALAGVVVGTVAFAGIGLALAGWLRGRGQPGRGQRPLPRAAAARRHDLPARRAARRAWRRWPSSCRARALAEVLRSALTTGAAPGRAWFTLLAWAVAAPVLAARTFRWE